MRLTLLSIESTSPCSRRSKKGRSNARARPDSARQSKASSCASPPTQIVGIWELLLSGWMHIRCLSECIYFVKLIPLHP